MKRLVPISILLSMVMAGPVFSADEATAPPVTAETREFDQQMSQMQDLMKQMQEQMRNIDAAKTDEERQKLLSQHWNSMQQGMQIMRRMWRSDATGCCMGADMTPERMAQHQQMMNQYMGMQQMMMMHMWGHTGWMMGPHGHMQGHHMMEMWQ